MIHIGTDIVEVPRIEALISRWPERFLLRIFTTEERAYCDRQRHPAVHYAGRFAAKEATRKALFAAGHGTTVPLRSIQVHRSDLGVPSITLVAVDQYQLSLSISHISSVAIATVALENNDPDDAPSKSDG